MYGPMSNLRRLCRNASVIFQPYLSLLDSNTCKLKYIKIHISNNKNVIQLQCTSVLGDYQEFVVIGINQEHESIISSNISCF